MSYEHIRSAKLPLRWHCWGWAVWMYLLGVAVCAWMSFGLPYLVGVPHQWIMSQDVWSTTSAAQYSWNGGAGYVYSANPWFAALPGFVYLYAPVVALAGHFGLVAGYPIPLQEPSMWLVTGPFFFLCGSTAVLGVDYLADTLQISKTRRRLIALAVAVLGVGPTAGFAGHPEDLVALALTCVSFALLLRGRLAGAAVALTCAILCQTWAGLALPALIAGTPKGLRWRTLLEAAAAPVFLGLALLVIDFHSAATSLLRQPMPAIGQRLPWWSFASHLEIQTVYGLQPMVAGSTTRFLAVVVAVGAAWAIRNRADSRSIMIAASLAMFARSFFEVEYWPYYVLPAAVMLVLLGAAGIPANPKRFGVLLCSALLMYATSTGSYSDWLMTPLLSLSILGVSGALGFVCAVRPFGVTRSSSPSDNNAIGRVPGTVTSLA